MRASGVVGWAGRRLDVRREPEERRLHVLSRLRGREDGVELERAEDLRDVRDRHRRPSLQVRLVPNRDDGGRPDRPPHAAEPPRGGPAGRPAPPRRPPRLPPGRALRVAGAVRSNTARTAAAPLKYASRNSCMNDRSPMMSRITRSTWTGAPARAATVTAV